MTPLSPYTAALARSASQLAGALLKTIPCARQFRTSTRRCTFQQPRTDDHLVVCAENSCAGLRGLDGKPLAGANGVCLYSVEAPSSRQRLCTSGRSPGVFCRWPLLVGKDRVPVAALQASAESLENLVEGEDLRIEDLIRTKMIEPADPPVWSSPSTHCPHLTTVEA